LTQSPEKFQSKRSISFTGRPAGPAADWAVKAQEAASVSAELAQAAMDYLALVLSLE
jgi:hypothetical protein